MTLDPYIDQTTGVLINKLGIADAEKLRKVVADISAARLDELAAKPLRGLYDLAHLRAFHKRIFGDVFPWAGQIRTIQIFKETGFCLPQNIERYACPFTGHAVMGAGSQGSPVRTRWMASMVVRPWLRALVR
jgi:cell filamentation protein